MCAHGNTAHLVDAVRLDRHILQEFVQKPPASETAHSVDRASIGSHSQIDQILAWYQVGRGTHREPL